MALWTSLRANQVAQRSLGRGRKEGKKATISYLLDSPKSQPRILLSTVFFVGYIHKFAVKEFVICLLIVLEKLRHIW